MSIGYHQYRRQLWRGRVFIGLLLVLCVLVGWSAITRFSVEREMAARRAAVEAEFAALQARHDALETEVQYLADERSLEAEVRKHFDVAREGESVVIIVDEDNESGSVAGAATSTALNPETHPWWQFWRVW